MVFRGGGPRRRPRPGGFDSGRPGTARAFGLTYNKAMAPTTGSLTIRHAEVNYTLLFADNGWMAAEMVQHIPGILATTEPEAAILRLLGYTMEISLEAPRRGADHWVEVALDERVLETNSDLIRKAVRGRRPDPEDPFAGFSLKRVHDALDQLDFTVRLVR